MKVLDRYVTWNLAISVFVSFSFVLCLYIMVHFFAHLDDLEAAERAFESRGLSLVAGIFRYHAITIPFVIAKLGPFAVLLAAMWTIQKMARDHEIVAAQVAGVSLHRLMAPILLSGVMLSIGLWAIRQHVLPRLAIENQEYERLMRGRKEAVLDGPMLVRDSAGTLFSIQSYDSASKVARGVQSRLADLSHVLDVSAMRFDLDANKWLVLSNSGPATLLPIETDLRPSDIEINGRAIRFLESTELEELARRLPGRLDLELMLQTRFTYPFATVVLLLLGLPLVVRRDRQSIYAAWGLCLFLSILYFGTENVLQGLAERDGVISPVLAAWVPIVVFGIGGALTYQDL